MAKFILLDSKENTNYMKTFLPPKKGEYAPYFETYLSLVPEKDLPELMVDQIHELRAFISSKPAGWDSSPYQEGKWTPKEIIGHLIDTDRIMTFRALCFARGEKAPLPGFDQDDYVRNANFGEVAIADLLLDFEQQRAAILSMMRTFPQDSLGHRGVANGNLATPRALLWIIPGHFIYHLNILKDRY